MSSDISRIKEVKITLIDIHENAWDFEGEDLRLSVEGVTTLVLKPNTKYPSGLEVIGSFINVAGSRKDVEE